MKMITENDRIYLREFTEDDRPNLATILQDPRVMYAYEQPFTEAQVDHWLNWLIASYEQHGFGLWAIVSRQSEQVVGECGLVWSKVNDMTLLEVGYHLKFAYWHQGYAREAALLCKSYAKEVLQSKYLTAIIRNNNESSIRVAQNVGMDKWQFFDKQYGDQSVPHTIYRVDF